MAISNNYILIYSQGFQIIHSFFVLFSSIYIKWDHTFSFGY